MADSYMDKLCPQGPGGEGGFDPMARVDEGTMKTLQDRAAALKKAQDRRRNGTVVFDIDGVLADSRWRLPLIRRKDQFKITLDVPNGGQTFHEFDGPRDEGRWEQFYGNSIADEPYTDGAALLKRMRDLFVVELWTGRPEWNRGVTLGWLRANDLLPYPQDYFAGSMDDAEYWEWSKVWLHMRPDKSRKPGYVVKTDWLRLFREEDLPDPLLVIDDDPEVVTAFGLEGIPAMMPIWHGEGVERVRG